MAEEFVDVIKDGQIKRVTAEEARQESLFVLRRPTLASGTPPKPVPSVIRPGQKQKYSLDYAHNNVRLDLVEHFNWEISKYRKLKNLSRRQLAQLVGSSEEDIKMLETGELPADNFALINKIEHYLGVILRRAAVSPSPAPVEETRMSSMSGRNFDTIDPKTVTLAELQKRREAARSKPAPVKSLKEIRKSDSISGGDIEIID